MEINSSGGAPSIRYEDDPAYSETAYKRAVEASRAGDGPPKVGWDDDESMFNFSRRSSATDAGSSMPPRQPAPSVQGSERSFLSSLSEYLFESGNEYPYVTPEVDEQHYEPDGKAPPLERDEEAAAYWNRAASTPSSHTPADASSEKPASYKAPSKASSKGRKQVRFVPEPTVLETSTSKASSQGKSSASKDDAASVLASHLPQNQDSGGSASKAPSTTDRTRSTSSRSAPRSTTSSKPRSIFSKAAFQKKADNDSARSERSGTSSASSVPTASSLRKARDQNIGKSFSEFAARTSTSSSVPPSGWKLKTSSERSGPPPLRRPPPPPPTSHSETVASLRSARTAKPTPDAKSTATELRSHRPHGAGSEGGSVRSAATSGVPSKAASRLKDEVSIRDFDSVTVKGDGNCLFRAGAVLQGLPEDNYDTFKKAVLDEVKGLDPGYFPEGVDSYVQGMEKDGAWGGEPEMAGLARVLGRKVVVLSNDPEQTLTYEPGSTSSSTNQEPAYLFHSGNHFDALRRRR